MKEGRAVSLWILIGGGTLLLLVCFGGAVLLRGFLFSWMETAPQRGTSVLPAATTKEFAPLVAEKPHGDDSAASLKAEKDGNEGEDTLIAVGPPVAPAEKDLAPGSGQVLYGTLRAVLGDDKHSKEAVAFSPDGKLLATAGHDNLVTLWDLPKGKVKRSLTGHSSWIQAIAWSPDGKTLASGGGDNALRLWDVATGQLKQTCRDKNAVLAVAFSPDSKVIASAHSLGDVKLWDAEDGGPRATIEKASDFVALSHIALAFSPDSKTLATGAKDKTIKLIDVQTGAVRASLAGHGKAVCGVVFSPDGKTLASVAFDDLQLKLWDLATQKERKTIRFESGATLGLQVHVAFSPGGKTLACGHGNGAPITLWDPQSGASRGNVTGLAGTVNCLAFSPDGNALAAVENYVNTVKIWDLEISRQKRTVALGKSISTVTCSPDGKLLVAAGWQTPAELRDAQTGTKKQTIAGVEGEPSALLFAPDSKTLAISNRRADILLWDVAAGKQRAILPTKLTSIFHLGYSPDGTTLAVVGRQFTQATEAPFRRQEEDVIQLWDTVSNQKKETLKGHRHTVLCLAFSADGRTLAEPGDIAAAGA
jgi:WD40 repeat protein